MSSPELDAGLPARIPHSAIPSLPRRGGGVAEAFLAARCPNTRYAYTADLRDFQRFVRADSAHKAAELFLRLDRPLAHQVALEYQAHLLDRGLSPATINRRISTLRSLTKVMSRVGAIRWQLELDPLRVEAYRDTAGPGREGYLRLLEVARSGVGPKALRDSALLRLLYDVALRRGEVVGLDLEHFDRERAVVWVQGKGRRQREPVSLPAPTLAAVQTWIDCRGPDPGPLFPNFDRSQKGGRNGRRLTGRSVARVVQDLGRRAGLELVRPHGLRHAAITDALDATQGDVRAVARFSRHKNLKVLTAYDDNRRDLGGKVAELIAPPELQTAEPTLIGRDTDLPHRAG